MDQLPHGATFRALASSALAKLSGKLVTVLETVLQDAGEEPVHDTRVAIRRMFQALTLFEPFLIRKRARKLRRQLKTVLSAAGQVRNNDIALGFCERWRVSPDSLLVTTLVSNRAAEHGRLIDAIHELQQRKTYGQWCERLFENAESGTEVTAHEFGAKLLPEMIEIYFRQGEIAASDATTPADKHRFRLDSKRLRYTLELFRPVYGKSVDTLLGHLRRIQELLGELNDCVATAELIRSLPVKTEPDARRVLTLLRRRVTTLRGRFKRFWNEDIANSGPPELQAREWIQSLGLNSNESSVRVSHSSW